MKVGLFGYEDTCVKAYNPVTKQLIGMYDNYSDAGNKLGMVPSVVQKICSRKGCVFSMVLQMQICLRLSKRRKKEELIADITGLPPAGCPEAYAKKCITGGEWNLEQLTQIPVLMLHNLWRALHPGR